MNKLVADIRSFMQKKPSRSSRAGQKKIKYEYDSDEDTEGGTWEHKARSMEMEETYGWLGTLKTLFIVCIVGVTKCIVEAFDHQHSRHLIA